MKKLFFLISILPSISFGVMRDISRINIPGIQDSVSSLGTQTLIDADGERIASCAINGNTDITISSITLFTQTITTGGRIDYWIQTMTGLGSATPGVPSGTLFCTNSSGTITTTGAEDNVAIGLGLVGNCVIPKMASFCVGVERPDGAGSTFAGSFYFRGNANYPSSLYSVVTTSIAAASWNRLTTTPTMLIMKNDGTYPKIPGTIVTSSVTTRTINTGSSQKELGNYIVPPVTSRVVGYKLSLDADASFDIVAYDNNGSEFNTVSFSSGTRSATTLNLFSVDVSTPWIAIGNKPYYVMVRPATTSNIGIAENCAAPFTNAEKVLESYPVAIEAFKTSGNVFGTNNRCYIDIKLVVDQIDDGGGGYGVSQ